MMLNSFSFAYFQILWSEIGEIRPEKGHDKIHLNWIQLTELFFWKYFRQLRISSCYDFCN